MLMDGRWQADGARRHYRLSFQAAEALAAQGIPLFPEK
jgi:hypothetical protein